MHVEFQEETLGVARGFLDLEAELSVELARDLLSRTVALAEPEERLLAAFYLWGPQHREEILKEGFTSIAERSFTRKAWPRKVVCEWVVGLTPDIESFSRVLARAWETANGETLFWTTCKLDLVNRIVDAFRDDWGDSKEIDDLLLANAIDPVISRAYFGSSIRISSMRLTTSSLAQAFSTVRS